MDLASELRLAIERVVRRFLGQMVGQLAQGLLLVALIPIVAILGFAVFGVLAIIVFGLYALLGEPKVLAPMVGVGWFFGSLLVLFFLLVRGHRWLSRLVALADAPAMAIDPYGNEPTTSAIEPGPSPFAYPASTFQERLMAADARHAPPEAPADPPRHNPLK